MSNGYKILIIDDDATVRMSLDMLLRRAGYTTESAASPDQALALMRAERYALILMDMNYSISTSGEEGLHLLRQAAIFQPEVPVILMTAWGSISLAVEGMKAGAFDFLTKPWTNRDLLQRIETALSLNKKTEGDAATPGFDRCGIIGHNRALLDVLDTVERVAATDAPVLILGENGTGKELIAKALHTNSRRSSNPFVMVNLGGISQSLFESEMFGYAKGAFTGAAGERKGRFEVADKGTIFLDEIGELDLSCQVKLLRVLQEHTFERLGESRPRKTDIRVVCATNADLNSMVARKLFREDLFYRINLVTLRLPALRERREDIPELTRHFIKTGAAEMHIDMPEISREALDRLSRYAFPGNIRQLKNMVERALIMCRNGRIEGSDFDTCVSSPGATPAGDEAGLELIEKQAIVSAIANSGGNLSRAAMNLGISRQALYRRMEKYGIEK